MRAAKAGVAVLAGVNGRAYVIACRSSLQVASAMGRTGVAAHHVSKSPEVVSVADRTRVG